METNEQTHKRDGASSRGSLDRDSDLGDFDPDGLGGLGLD